MLTVAQLIEVLQTFPDQEALVAFQSCNKQYLLEARHLRMPKLCEPRLDGLIKSKRSGMPTRTYLLFPGN
jgi:hypothetical protein